MKEIKSIFRKRIVIIFTTLFLGVSIFPAISGYENENNPPVADAGGPYIGFEGSTVYLDASKSYDPDGDNLIYNWDLDGDEFIDFRFWFDSPYLDWIWYDDYHGSVTIFVIDDHDVLDDDTTTADIYNVAPSIISLNGLPMDPVPIGESLGLTSVFTDPGIFDTHTATIDWGDGTVNDVSINENTVTGSHTYDLAGVYTVMLTVTDDDGGSDVAIFQYVVVYNPNVGFVTGGGWIDSPEGAFVPEPSLTGKATFGFVSKYKKGQTIPSGNTEFQFHVAGLNFHSNNYDWLIVAGAKAKFKGTGTINNIGNFGFMLFAIDEDLTPSSDVDLFRIKIWDKDNNDIVIYDNQIGDDENADPTTEVRGGQIKIHKC